MPRLNVASVELPSFLIRSQVVGKSVVQTRRGPFEHHSFWTSSPREEMKWEEYHPAK